jgi:hypothetical protein
MRYAPAVFYALSFAAHPGIRFAIPQNSFSELQKNLGNRFEVFNPYQQPYATGYCRGARPRTLPRLERQQFRQK